MGTLLGIHPVFSPLEIFRESNPQPFTNLVLRRNLISVISLANTYKTWCVRKDSNLQLYHTKSLADSQGTRTLSLGCRPTCTISLLTQKLDAGLGFEPRMAKAYETLLLTRHFPQKLWLLRYSSHSTLLTLASPAQWAAKHRNKTW
jgi:hypothetical protein